MARRLWNPFRSISESINEITKDRFQTEINISEKYAMEIFTQVLNHSIVERDKIIKKIENLKKKL